MNHTLRDRLSGQFAGILFAGFVLFAAIKLALPDGATAQAAPPHEKEKANPAEHAQRAAALHEALVGTFDIFFDVSQVESDKPLISGARYVDLVDVTGKELLRIVDTKSHQWLIDPDTVLTYRIHPKGTKDK